MKWQQRMNKTKMKIKKNQIRKLLNMEKKKKKKPKSEKL